MGRTTVLKSVCEHLSSDMFCIVHVVSKGRHQDQNKILKAIDSLLSGCTLVCVCVCRSRSVYGSLDLFFICVRISAWHQQYVKRRVDQRSVGVFLCFKILLRKGFLLNWILLCLNLIRKAIKSCTVFR